jgi:carbon storage regulator
MLVLSRKMNQSIKVGDDIEIYIINIDRDQVKIGVKAPKNIAIYRKEIYDEIQAENLRAILKEKEELLRIGAELKNFVKKPEGKSPVNKKTQKHL